MVPSRYSAILLGTNTWGGTPTLINSNNSVSPKRPSDSVSVLSLNLPTLGVSVTKPKSSETNLEINGVEIITESPIKPRVSETVMSLWRRHETASAMLIAGSDMSATLKRPDETASPTDMDGSEISIILLRFNDVPSTKEMLGSSIETGR